MSVAKNYKMRFITRIDQDGQHNYWVRLAVGTPYYIQESFTDLCYGGKRKALRAAQRFRDKMEETLKVEYGITFPRSHRQKDKGVNRAKQKRADGEYYYCWRATFWDTKKKKQLVKCFGINKYGDRKAEKLARQWRNLKDTGELNNIE